MFQAFQENAFQFDSFQMDIGILGPAFQPCAFQDDAFQTTECPIEVDAEIPLGQGNWYKTPKRRIKLVRKLTKELEEIQLKKLELVEQAKTEEQVKQLVELDIYEKLVFDELTVEFDKKAVEQDKELEKTRLILEKIQLDLEEKKKAAQLDEEEAIILAIMAIL